jgi:hypothetical protein
MNDDKLCMYYCRMPQEARRPKIEEKLRIFLGLSSAVREMGRRFFSVGWLFRTMSTSLLVR